MQALRIPYADTRRFSPLVTDYLSGRETLREFYGPAPDREGLLAAAAQRTFCAEDRLVLCTALTRQYEGLALQEAVRDNLAALRRPDALTVTTGHQLCLFGGPLYVTFKILNVVRLARQLSGELGEPVVPIFWMATEDHDRPEIDHTWMNGTRVHWPGEAAGAVGRLVLYDIDAVLKQAAELLGPGMEAASVRDLLYACYRPDRTLAEATRCFMNALFGRFGLVIVDGDDPALKRLFVPVMREELLHQVTERCVQYANDKLGTAYTVQAHARPINLFHLRPGHRSRIVQEGGQYTALNGGPRWTMDELLAELGEHPEHFSPNVLMRPLYQESILPNIAYVGGGGELAYWLQLRWLFQALRIPMPVVLLRTSAGFVDGKQLRNWRATGLTLEELFEPLEATKTRVALRVAGATVDLGAEREELRSFHARLAERVSLVDPTLRAAVEADATRSMKRLDRIATSLLRAVKRRERDALGRMDRAHAAFFPGGGLQERRDNILPMLATYGTGLLEELLAQLDPLDGQFTIFEQ